MLFAQLQMDFCSFVKKKKKKKLFFFIQELSLVVRAEN